LEATQLAIAGPFDNARVGRSERRDRNRLSQLLQNLLSPFTIEQALGGPPTYDIDGPVC
jgi:hypothetical protein